MKQLNHNTTRILYGAGATLATLIAIPLLAWYVHSIALLIARQQAREAVEIQKLYSSIERTKRAYINKRTDAYVKQLNAIEPYFDTSEQMLHYFSTVHN